MTAPRKRPAAQRDQMFDRDVGEPASAQRADPCGDPADQPENQADLRIIEREGAQKIGCAKPPGIAGEGVRVTPKVTPEACLLARRLLIEGGRHCRCRRWRIFPAAASHHQLEDDGECTLGRPMTRKAMRQRNYAPASRRRWRRSWSRAGCRMNRRHRRAPGLRAGNNRRSPNGRAGSSRPRRRRRRRARETIERNSWPCRRQRS